MPRLVAIILKEHDLRPDKFWREGVIALIAITPFAFHFLSHEIILSFDTTHLFYVMKRWYMDHWLRGEFPLWNSGIFTGYFQLASPAIAIFSPTTPLFYYLFKTVWAEEFQLPLFAVLAGLGFYRLALELIEDRDIALMSGIGYALSGPLLSFTDRSSMFFSASLYPWLFGFALKLLRQQFSAWIAVGLSFTLAMMMIHGDWISVAVGIGTLITGFLIKPQSWRAGITLLVFIVAGIGLSMVSVLPTLADVATTSRAHGFGFESASYFSLHPFRLLNLFAPEIWGQPYSNNFWGTSIANAYRSNRFWFHSLYLGLPVLVASAIGVWTKRRSRHVQAMAVGFVFLTCLAFGKHFLLHRLIFDFVGPYQKLRFPEKFVYYSLFVISVFAVWGFEQLRKQDLWKWFWRGLAASYLALSVGDLVVSQFMTLEPSALREITVAMFEHLALTITSGALAFKLSRSTMALTACLVLDLVCFAPTHHWFPASSLEQSESLSSQMNKESGRFVRDQSLDAFTNGAAASSLQPNLHMLAEQESIFGYETSNPLRVERIVGPEVFRHLDVWSPILKIKYVLSTQKPREKNLKSWFEQGKLRVGATDSKLNAVLLKVAEDPARFQGYSNAVSVHTGEEALSAVLGRKPGVDLAIVEDFDWVPDSSGDPLNLKVSLGKQAPDYHEYSIDSDKRFLFVERENFHEGWTAQLDRQPTRLIQADYLNRAVEVPAGHHQLTLEFHSKAFDRGVLVSVASLLFLLASLLVGCLRQFSAHDKVFDDLGVS